MSKPWSDIRLGEVLRLNVDRVHVDPAATYDMVGVLSFGRGLFDREPVHGQKTSYKHFYRLNADHVVMSQLFGWEGALALSSEQFAGKYVSPQFPTFLPDESRLDRRFLGWLMKRPSFWEDLGTRTSGMGDRRRTLNPKSLFACKIPLPPISEQRRIVGRIEELQSAIEQARALRNESAADTDAFCRSVLSHDEAPTPAPMSELLKLRSPDILVRADETYDFAGVYCFGRGLFRSGTKTGMEFSYRKLTRLKIGNFVYPKLMAWEGAFGMVPPECEKCVVSPEFPVFEVNEDRIFPEVLDTYFRDPAIWPEVAGSSRGTNVRRRRLHPKIFLAYRMPVPSRKTQELLREVRAEVDALKRLQAETAAELDALLPSILDKAFRGEL